jgi:D-sedoheptulose 7-phosphate isomerase
MNLEIIEKEIQDHIELASYLKEVLPSLINEASDHILNAINNGNKVILFGNGGSASDAQHIAAEFTGRFVKERKGLPAMALTTDTSALTAIGNDYGFNFIFSRQVEAIAKSGDIIIGISTSGDSENVYSAIELANKLGCFTISFTGKDGGRIKTVSKLNININSPITARIQEMHILVGHLICSVVDNAS